VDKVPARGATCPVAVGKAAGKEPGGVLAGFIAVDSPRVRSLSGSRASLPGC
jgi:hypothetical protein